MKAARGSGGTFVSSRAVIGAGVQIGSGAQIFGNVVVGAGTLIDADVTLGYPAAEAIRERQGDPRFSSAEELLDDAASQTTMVGPRSIIRRFCVIYEGVKTGQMLDCAHDVTVREGCVLGDSIELGPLSYVKRDCQIGDHSRISGELCDRSEVGRHCTVYGRTIHKFYSGISGLKEDSPILEDGVIVGREACIVGPVVVGRLALVGAGAIVTESVPPKTVVAGNPAKFLRDREREEAVDLWQRVEDLGTREVSS